MLQIGYLPMKISYVAKAAHFDISSRVSVARFELFMQ